MTDQPSSTGQGRRLRLTAWILAGAAFVAGPLIGMNIDANVGAGLWIASAGLALAPFASHRNK